MAPHNKQEVIILGGVCNFIPAKGKDDLKPVLFVYETEFKRLQQPFIYPINYIFLVVRGEATLKLLSHEYPLSEGTLFFGFPGVPFEIEGSDNFTYTYISFMGLRGREILKELGVDTLHPIRQGFEGLIDFWKNAIRRLDRRNAGILTESVLLYTLSYVKNEEDCDADDKGDAFIESLVSYIDNNYTDHDMSLKKVADIFAYTDKYLSHIFKERMQMNFSVYLTRLRLQKALELMRNGRRDVSEIALECGFSDASYFSKVFKKSVGKTPHEYITNRTFNEGISPYRLP